MELDVEKSPIWWFSTFFHEAGHAVAAAKCGRPVQELYIHPVDGFTHHGLPDVEDDPDEMKFVISAGPWAEVKSLRLIAGIAEDGDTDAGQPSFADTWRELFRKNLSDWRDYHRDALGYQVSNDDLEKVNSAYFYPGTTSLPDYESLPDGGSDALPAEFWVEVRQLAVTMMEAAPEIDVGYGQPLLRQIDTTRWRRSSD